MDGKRTRTLRTASYRDDDAHSDSEDDPEDLFKPGKDYASSSDESVTEPSAKKKVCPPHTLPQPTALPVLIFHLALITETGCGQNQCDGCGRKQRTHREEKSNTATLSQHFSARQASHVWFTYASIFLSSQKPKAKKIKGMKGLPGQKFGNEAIGTNVTRQFGDEGSFTGIVAAFRKMGSNHVYTVQYVDGDVEDVDIGEYNLGFEMFLRESGWKPEALALQEDVKPTTRKKPTKINTAARDRIEAVIDLTTASSIAGKHIDSMDDSSRCAVIELAQKNHRKLENKNVKAAVLEVQYAGLCREAFLQHLQAKVTPANAMQHPRRPTLMENQATLAKLTIGDWVFATEDMSPRVNSEAGYGCISALHLKEQIGDAEPTVESVDLRWLIANRSERRVQVARLKVVKHEKHKYTFIFCHLYIVPCCV